MASSQYDCIIIGSGIGGLCTGAVLARRGKKICVLEKQHQAGGYAAHFKRKNFEFEVSLQQIGGINKTFLKYILMDSGISAKVKFKKHAYLYEAISEHDELNVPNGNIKLLKKILYGKFPREKFGIRLWFFLIWKIGRESFWWDRAVRSKFLLPLLYFIAPILFPFITFSHKISLQKVLDLCTKSTPLKAILMQLLKYYGNSLDIACLLPLIATYGYYYDGGYYPEGGSKAISEAFVKTIREGGGDVFTSNEVVQIITEDNRAVGVRTNKGETFFSQVIICNISPFKVYDSLLSGWKGSHKQLAINRKMLIGPTMSNLHLGLDIPIAELNQRFAKSYIVILNSGTSSPNTLACYSNMDSGICPKDKSILSVTYMDNYDTWAQLSTEEYRKTKKKEYGRVLAILEQHLPGISSHVEVAELATPMTMERYTGNPKGAIYGFAQSIGQAGLDRFKNKGPLKNLYFASAWTFPGGGFEGAMRAGHKVAREIFSSL